MTKYTVVYKYNLKAYNISCFDADNSSVNYISCISILHLNIQTLCKETVTVMLYTTRLENSIHKYDADVLILNVFNELSSSVQKLQELECSFKFLEQEYSSLLRHEPGVGSMFSALDRMLKNWKPIRYMPSRGEEEINPLIWSFIRGQENLNDDDLTQPECYIYFLLNSMTFTAKLCYLYITNNNQCFTVTHVTLLLFCNFFLLCISLFRFLVTLS